MSIFVYPFLETFVFQTKIVFYSLIFGISSFFPTFLCSRKSRWIFSTISRWIFYISPIENRYLKVLKARIVSLIGFLLKLKKINQSKEKLFFFVFSSFLPEWALTFWLLSIYLQFKSTMEKKKQKEVFFLIRQKIEKRFTLLGKINFYRLS